MRCYSNTQIPTKPSVSQANTISLDISQWNSYTCSTLSRACVWGKGCLCVLLRVTKSASMNQSIFYMTLFFWILAKPGSPLDQPILAHFTFLFCLNVYKFKSKKKIQKYRAKISVVEFKPIFLKSSLAWRTYRANPNRTISFWTNIFAIQLGLARPDGPTRRSDWLGPFYWHCTLAKILLLNKSVREGLQVTKGRRKKLIDFSLMVKTIKKDMWKVVAMGLRS